MIYKLAYESHFEHCELHVVINPQLGCLLLE